MRSSAKPHSVAFLVYPGFQLLDATGPAAVFAEARHPAAAPGQGALYAVEMVSAEGGAVASSCGVAVQTRAIERVPARRVATLLIAGADRQYLAAACQSHAVRRWVVACAKSATRVGSICSGAFVLATAGLLAGKRVATHWEAAAPLGKAYPTTTVDAEALYVEDGKVWTSAGVTAGIDMALAMVASDAGPEVAHHVAKRFVLYARRPGYQSQFSPLLEAQAKADGTFAELIAWIEANLARRLSVPRLAERAGLSERSFYRKFVATTGQTPARFVEAVRLEAARVLLSQGLSLKSIAAQVGLSPASRLTQAFERRFGVPPALFRSLHSSSIS